MTHAFRFITIILATFITILIIIHSLQLLHSLCLFFLKGGQYQISVEEDKNDLAVRSQACLPSHCRLGPFNIPLTGIFHVGKDVKKKDVF